jgi:hypothetical protein
MPLRQPGANKLEHPPTEFIPAPLVLDDQRTDRLGELVALPCPLEVAGELLIAWPVSASPLDRVGGGSEVVLSNVSHARGLACRVGGNGAGQPVMRRIVSRSASVLV